ncbi:MAG: N-acetyltransferase [Actinomycetia bacterium]|nr:N-acetyltransferase [Actinomycetes bacterium]
MTTVTAPLPDIDEPLADDIVMMRWFERKDAAALVDVCRDPEIPRWTYMPDDLDLRSARAWIDRRSQARRLGRSATFAVIDRSLGVLGGQCGVALDRTRNAGEAFYWVAAPSRRKGVASAALRLLVRYAFDTLGLERVELKIDPENAASQAVARAGGFTYEGTLRSDQPFKGRRMDSQVWSRLPTDP